jgi:hypothetical protein
MRQTLSFLVAGVTLAMWLAGCGTMNVAVTEAPGMQLAGRYKFRMNFDVHDPDGAKITEEIMQNDLDHWYQFMELVSATRASLEDRGYQWVSDPTEPADFVVDMCFTAFYSDTLDEERMKTQKLATFLVGRKTDDTYQHLVVIAALARDPQLKSVDYVTIWEGRATAQDSQQDARLWALPLIGDIVAAFPEVEVRAQ